MYQAIVFLPLVGFFIAGLFGRLIGARASEVATTSLLAVSAVLSWVAFADVGFGTGATQVAVATWFDVVTDAVNQAGASCSLDLDQMRELLKRS